MTKTKKVVAMLLALLMLTSTFSVLGHAATYPVQGTHTLSVNTEVAVDKSGNGTWEVTDTVKPGDNVKVYVYVGTDYLSTSAELLLRYDADFFSHSYGTALVNLADPNNYKMNASNATVSSTGAGASIRADMIEPGTIYVWLTAPQTGVFQYDANTYMFTLDFTVKSSADLTTANEFSGKVWADEDDIMFEPQTDDDWDELADRYTNFPYGEQGDLARDTLSMDMWNASTSFTESTVTVSNTVDFITGVGTQTTTTLGNMAGDTVNIPDPTVSGYTFTGWTNVSNPGTPAASVTAPAANASTYEVPYETGVKFEAQYIQNVTIHFDTDTAHGGSSIPDITDVTGGAAWTNPPANPTKNDGTYDYKFMGWEFDGVNIGTSLPGTYPEADNGQTVFTYTALWKKYIKVEYDANGGTIAGDASPYQGGEAQGELVNVYEGNTWDTNDVPTYPVTNFSNANVTKAGNSLVGWRSSIDNSVISTFPANYPDSNVTYTAVWDPHQVQVRLYYDDSASILDANDNPDATVITAIEAGTPISIVSKYYGDTYTVPSTVPGTNDTVTTWYYIDGNNQVQTVAAGSTITVNTTLLKLATSASEQGLYNVTYTLGGNGTWDGTDSADKSVSYHTGDPIPKQGDNYYGAVPQGSNGRVFQGWEPAVSYMGTDNITLTASWSDPTSFNIIYYDDQTGTAVPLYTNVADSTFEYEEDETVDAPDEPEREGYTFSGWAVYTDSAMQTAYTGTVDSDTGLPTAMPAQNLWAKTIWTVNQYPVHFDFGVDQDDPDQAAFVSATQTDPEMVDYGDDLPAPDATRGDGYKNPPEWSYYTDAAHTQGYDPNNGMPAQDIYALATWEEQDFTLNVVVLEDTSLNEDSQVLYKELIEDYLPADPEVEGYTFDSWEYYTDSNFTAAYTGTEMPAYDIWAKAVMTINSHDVTYDFNVPMGDQDPASFVDATQTQTVTKNFNDALPANTPAAQRGDGFTFSGWTYTYVDENQQTQTLASGATMPDYDVTATANWTPKNYSIHFIPNGGTPDPITNVTGAYRSDISSQWPANPTKQGYVFDGWYIANAQGQPTGDLFCAANSTVSTMPLIGASDGAMLNVAAKWTPYAFTIRFDEDGGNTVNDIVNVAYEAPITWPADPEKDGYTFAGWYVKENGAMTDTLYCAANSSIATMPLIGANGAVLDLMAKWEAVEYTITYVMNGGVYDTAPAGLTPVENSENYEYKADFATPVTQPADPAKTGYTFGGWYTDSGLNTPVNWTNLTMPLNGASYYAKWNENTYDVVYNLDGGQIGGSTASITKNRTYTQALGTGAPATDPVKEGYSFQGWIYSYNDGNNDVAAAATDVNIPFDASALADWGEESYTVTYNLDGGNYSGDTGAVVKNRNYTQAVGYDAPATNPEKEGYSFQGWTYQYNDGEHTVDVTAADTNIAYPVTATANWQVNSYTVTYTLDGGNIGGSTENVVRNRLYTEAVNKDKPANPVKEGYRFDGWTYTYTEGQNTVTVAATDTNVAHDVTVTPIWTELSYNVVYNLDGGNYSGDTSNVTVQRLYTNTVDTNKPATNPVKEGYTFGSWAYTYNNNSVAASDTNIAGDITATAQWNINSPLVTYDKNNSQAAFADSTYDQPVAVQYGTTLPDAATAPAVSAGAYYRFDGWTYYTDASYNNVYSGTTMPDQPLYARAAWTQGYDVVFHVNFTGRELEEAGTKIAFEGDTFNSSGITVPTVAAGYGFQGWALSAGATSGVTDVNTAIGTMSAALRDQNDNKVHVYATWLAGLHNYKVYTYTMNTDGTYNTAPDTEPAQKSAAVDATVNEAPATVADGFDLDTLYTGDANHPAYKASGVVLADDSLELYIYIARNPHTVEFDTDGGAPAQADQTVLFGAALPAPTGITKTGYTPAGWTYFEEQAHSTPVSGTTMPDQDVYALMTWTENEYDVEYNLDGGKIGTNGANVTVQRKYTAEAQANKPADPVKEGYTFQGWIYDNGAVSKTDVNIARNLTAKADWSEDSYKVTYTLDGGNISGDTNDVEVYRLYTAEAQANKPATDPEKTGFTFEGWTYTYLEGSDPVTVNATDKNIAKELTATAQWSRNSYKVYFDLDDDTLDPATFGGTYSGSDATGNYITKAYATETIPNPSASRGDGYRFDGWSFTYTDDQGNHTASAGDPMPAANVNAVAQWTKRDFAMTFVVLEDDTQNTSTRIEYREPIDEPEDPDITGSTFSKWKYYTDEDLSVEYTGNLADGMPARDLWAKAVWDLNTRKVYFDLNDDALDAAEFTATLAEDATGKYIEVEFGGAIPAPAATRGDGYEHPPVWSYYTDDTYATEYEVNNLMPDYNLFAQAEWTKKFFPVNFVVEEDENQSSDTPVEYRAPIDEPEDPEITGYTFAEWKYYTDEDLTAAYTGDLDDGMPAFELWAKATWTPNTYKVYVDLNDADNDGADPATFGGSYDGQDATGNYIEVTYGTDTVPVLSATRMPGYSPDDIPWSYTYTDGDGDHETGAGNAVPAANVFAQAQWKKNEFTMSFVVPEDTTQNSSSPIEYREPIDEPDDPEVEGYTFTGWDYFTNQGMTTAYTGNLADGMPAQNLWAKAAMNEHQLNVTYTLDGGELGDSTDDITVTRMYTERVDTNKPAGTPEKTGYDFKGWTYSYNDGTQTVSPAADATNIDYNITATAQWDYADFYVDYTIGNPQASFKNQDDHPSLVTYHEDDLPAPELNNNDDYKEFVEWKYYNDAAKTDEYTGEKMPSNDIWAVATWNDGYDVDFIFNLDVEGRKNEVVDSKIVFEGKPITAEGIDAPSYNAGYNFLGWSLADDGTVDTDLGTMSDAVRNQDDKVLVYAIWSLDSATYKVRTYTMGTDGQYTDYVETTGQALPVDTPVDATPASVDDGFYFDAATTGDKATGKILVDGSLVLEVYIGRTQYEIEYDPDGPVKQFYFGEEINADGITPDVVEGYTFSEWLYFNNEARNDTYSGTTMPARDLWAKSKYTENTYAVIYKLDASDTGSYAEITRYYTDRVDKDAPANPTREGNNFMGWSYSYYDGTDTIATTADATGIPYDVDALAIWLPYDIVVRFVDANNELLAMRTVAFGDTITLPVMSGVAAWAYDNTNYIPGNDYTVTSPTSITFVAVDEQNSYTVTFDAAGGKFANDQETDVKVYNATTGYAMVAPADPTREGFTFDGWEPSVPATVTETVTFTASWTATSFNAKYYLSEQDVTNDNPYAVIPVESGENLVDNLPEEPEIEGYTFNGWTYTDNDGTHVVDENTVMPAGSGLAIVAQFTANDYTITYVMNGGDFETVPAGFEKDTATGDYTYEAAYATAVSKPADPKLEGYNFKGWFIDDEFNTAVDWTTFTSMPAEDSIFYAKFEIADFTVSYDKNNADAAFADATYEQPVDITYQQAIPEPVVSAGDYYRFDGWTFYEDDQYATEYTGNLEDGMPAKDLYAKANWTKGYDVVYIWNLYEEGVVDKKDDVVTGYSDIVFEGEPITTTGKAALTYAAGYAFKGWNLDRTATDGAASTTLGTMSTALRNQDDIVPVYAIWGIGENTYYIHTYKMDVDGTYPVTPDETFGGAHAGVHVVANPTVEDGFYLDIEYTGDADHPAYMDEGNVIAEGDNGYPLTLNVYIARKGNTVKFDTDGGTPAQADQTVLFGAALPAPTGITKTGYTSTGWTYYEDEGHNTLISGNTMPNQDVYALLTWQINDYKVYYDLNDNDGIADAASFDDPTAVTFDADTGKYYIEVPYEGTVTAPAASRGDGFKTATWEFFEDAALQEGFDTNNTMPAHDIYAVAQWEKNEFVMSFVVPEDTAQNSSSPIEYLEPVDEPEDPEITGYTFKEWKYYTDEDLSIAYTGNLDDGMPAQNLWAKATWTEDSYEVVYSLAGGKIGESTDDVTVSRKYTDEAQANKPADPTKEGYRFNGWIYDGGAVAKTDTKIDRALTAVADWEELSYNVVYKLNGGKIGESTDDITVSRKYTDEAQANAPANPVLEGSDFSGWRYTYLDGETTVNVGKTDKNLAVELTATAQWDLNTYKVFYDLNDNDGIADAASFDDPAAVTIDADTGKYCIEVPYEGTVTAPAASRGDGFKAATWEFYNDAALQDGFDPNNTMPAHDIYAVAQWEKNDFAMTFVVDEDSTQGSSSRIEYLEPIDEPEDPEVPGYTFGGWNYFTDEACETAYTGNLDDGMPAQNLWAKADMEANTYKIYVDLNDADNDGADPATFTYNNGAYDGTDATGNYIEVTYASDTVPTLTATRLPGYSPDPNTPWTYFYTDDQGDQQPVAPGDAVPAADIFATAQWENNSFTVNFVVTEDDTQNSNAIVEYREPIDEPADPEIDGYTFDKWVYYTDENLETAYTGNFDDGMPAQNLWAKATFDEDSYDVVYSLAGGKIGDSTDDVTVSRNYTDEAQANKPADPTRDGYRFLGWIYDGGAVEKTDTKINRDLTATAEWEKGYTVTFYRNYDENDTTVAGTKLLFEGDDITCKDIPVPTRENFGFAGWSLSQDATSGITNTETAIGTMGTADVPVYATWSAEVANYTVNTYTMQDDGTYPAQPATETKTGSIGTEVTETTTPPEHYHVDTALTNNTGTVAADNSLVLNIYYAIDTFTVTYTLNGGKIGGSEADVVVNRLYTDEAQANKPANPTKDGFDFMGWTYSYGEGENVVAVNPTAKNIAEDLNAAPIWTAQDLQVKYYVDGELVKSAGTVAYDGTVVAAEYDNDSITVIKWQNGTSETYTLPGREYTPTAADLTAGGVNFYAFTDDNVTTEYKEYTVTFYGITDDVVISTKSDYHYGDTITEPASADIPAIEGMHFVSWDAVPATVTGDAEFRAQYETDIVTLKVYNDPDDTEPFFEAPVDYGSTILDEIPDEPETGKTGYTFGGWGDAEGKPIADDAVAKANTEIFPIWVANNHQITFVPNNGDENITYNLDYGTAIVAPAVENDDYNLAGWYLDDETFEQKFTDTTMPDNDVTVYAKWVNDNTYTIIFDADGGKFEDTGLGEYKIENALYGDPITVPANPVKEGYVFGGWDPTPSANVRANETYTAQWDEDTTIAVKFVDGDDVIFDGEMTYGEPIDVPEDLDKDNATFAGWVIYKADDEGNPTDEVYDGDTVPAFPITGVAQWSITVNFYLTEADKTAGNVYATFTKTTGEMPITAADMPADPSGAAIEGNTFEGWNPDIVGQTLTENTDVIAILTPVQAGVVKLVPINENSTAMIERGGVVETYNERILDQTREDKLPLPRNVSAVRATEDEYGYATYDEDAKEYDSWYIYGLRVGTRSAALAGDNNDIFDFVKVTNGGRMEILSETGGTPRRNVGTGTIIKVYDTKGTPDDNTDDVFVEQFRVVIYGDLTFDGNVNVADSTKIDTELDYRDWSLNNPEKRVPYLFRAADIAMQNNGLNVADSTMFDTILDKQTTREVDFQINGRGVVPAQG